MYIDEVEFLQSLEERELSELVLMPLFDKWVITTSDMFMVRLKMAKTSSLVAMTL
jgi:hypothetical protein